MTDRLEQPLLDPGDDEQALAMVQLLQSRLQAVPDEQLLEEQLQQLEQQRTSLNYWLAHRPQTEEEIEYLVETYGWPAGIEDLSEDYEVKIYEVPSEARVYSFAFETFQLEFIRTQAAKVTDALRKRLASEANDEMGDPDTDYSLWVSELISDRLQSLTIQEIIGSIDAVNVYHVEPYRRYLKTGDVVEFTDSLKSEVMRLFNVERYLIGRVRAELRGIKEKARNAEMQRRGVQRIWDTVTNWMSKKKKNG